VADCRLIKLISKSDLTFGRSKGNAMRVLACVSLMLVLLSAGAARGADPHAAGAGAGAHHAHIGEDVSAHVTDPKDVQLELGVFTLFVFLLLFGGLRIAAWPKISAALTAREEGIRRAITDAEKARIDSAEMLRQHQAKLDAVQEEVKAILATARKDAEQVKNDIVASANTEATNIKNRAVADINVAKDQALQEVFGKMADQVAAATTQVVGRTVTGDDQNRFIREALSQVSPN
jgi:F-type H+-transporting ATPase subunit b